MGAKIKRRVGKSAAMMKVQLAARVQEKILSSVKLLPSGLGVERNRDSIRRTAIRLTSAATTSVYVLRYPHVVVISHDAIERHAYRIALISLCTQLQVTRIA